jgi:hypothetical protein
MVAAAMARRKFRRLAVKTSRFTALSLMAIPATPQKLYGKEAAATLRYDSEDQ